MLRRLFARSLLAKRITEARDAYRDLRITHYRGALRAKRAAVRAAVISEIHHAKLQQLTQRRDTAIKLIALRSRLAEGDAYKADAATRVRKLVQENASGGPGARLVAEAVEGAVAGTHVDPDADRAAMAAQVVAGVATAADVTDEELDDMLRTIAPDDKVTQDAIRRNVMVALEQARDDKQRLDGERRGNVRSVGGGAE